MAVVPSSRLITVQTQWRLIADVFSLSLYEAFALGLDSDRPRVRLIMWHSTS